MENTENPAYMAALEYIFRFVQNSRTHQKDLPKPAETSPARMEKILAALGNPHLAFQSIHITGTKGKGSTAAFCAAGLQAAGYRVGLNTSPHLQTFRERMQINRKLISEEQVVQLVARLQPIIENIPDLTSFELITCLAFLYFAEQQVDFAVIEVGMGGRTDATNILKPLVSIITSISFDHTEFLGNTLEAIAAEKAGIIKPGVPVVIGPGIPEEPRQVIAQAAYQNNAPLFEIGEAFRYMPLRHSLADQSQSFWTWTAAEQEKMDDFLENQAPGWHPIELSIPLLGKHQVENAMAAYTALHIVDSLGFPVPCSAIQDGFLDVRWAGRFEILQASPTIVVDAAHNQASAHRLLETLNDYFPEIPIWVIFGASRGKDVVQIIQELQPRITRLLITRTSHPRAADPEALAAQLLSTGLPMQVFASVEQTLEYTLDNLPNGAVLLVTGSTFIAGAVRDLLALHTVPGKRI